MYKLEFLPLARQDMVEIIRYIGVELKNPIAAHRLAEKLVAEAYTIPELPYANPPYIPPRPLKHEYRKKFVDSYLMLYWVNEQEKTVTVARVVYSRSDYGNDLELSPDHPSDQ